MLHLMPGSVVVRVCMCAAGVNAELENATPRTLEHVRANEIGILEDYCKHANVYTQ